MRWDPYCSLVLYKPLHRGKCLLRKAKCNQWAHLVRLRPGTQLCIVRAPPKELGRLVSERQDRRVAAAAGGTTTGGTCAPDVERAGKGQGDERSDGAASAELAEQPLQAV